MQVVYRRDLSAIGVVITVAAAICMLTYRLWLPMWLGYLWLRHRHDGTTTEWLTVEDIYCMQYFADPTIAELLDEYVDFVCAGLAGVLAGHLSAADALPTTYYDLCSRLERAIAEHIWQEDPKLDRTIIADRRWVWQTTKERAGELTSRMFWGPPALEFDEDYGKDT